MVVTREQQEGGTSNATFSSNATTTEVEGEGRISQIRYIENEDGTILQRQGHLAVMLPLSRLVEDDERQLIEFRVYVELSAFLAFQHIQHKNSIVLPHLQERLQKCTDFTWTYEHYDTMFSPLQAAKGLMERQELLVASNANTNTNHEPPTLIGTTFEIIPFEEDDDDDEPEVVIVSDDDTFEGEEDLLSATNSTPQTMPLFNQTTYPYNNNSATRTRRRRRRVKSNNRHKRRLPQSATKTEDVVTDATTTTTRSTKQQPPFAIMGAARSVVSETLGILGSAFELPQISSSSTASSLEEAPYFARTIPTNAGDAHAIMAYLKMTLQVPNVGVLFVDDSWGRRYHQDLQFYANQYGIRLHSVPYSDQQLFNMEGPIQQLQQSMVRYFIGVINPSSWKPVIRQLYHAALMGNSKYQWFLGDIIELVGDNFELDATTEWDLAQALHGAGVTLLKVELHQALDDAIASVATNQTLRDAFVAHHAEPHLFDNFTFRSSFGRSLYQYLTYDAVMALGLTACETPGLFTGQEFYDNLLQIDFEGVSGRVQLNEETGTRMGDVLTFEIVNLVLQDDDDHDEDAATAGSSTDASSLLSFDARSSIMIDLSPTYHDATAMPLIQVETPFVYHDNSTNPPAVLPPIEENMNLIPNGLRYFGIALATLVMILSIGCALWTHSYREEYVVRAAQPIFLYQICVGTFIISWTIVLLSFQEPVHIGTLDAACATIPWTACIGFTVAIAALYSKARRINKVMITSSSRKNKQNNRMLRRVKVTPADVIWPVVIMLHVNWGFLLGWTGSPYRLTWQRIPIDNNYDILGRSVESFGACRPDSSSWFLLFAIPLFLMNLLVLARATHASYKGRNLPTEFSETKYLVMSLVGLSETFLLGGVTLATILDDPTAFFMVSSLLICIGSLSILVPVFLPKYLQRNVQEPSRRQTTNLLRGQGGNKYNWRTPEASAESSVSTNVDTPRSSSHFFASEPMAIRRISSGLETSTAKQPSSGRRSDQRLVATDFIEKTGNALSEIARAPAAIVAKAILLQNPAVSEGSTATAVDSLKSRLDVLPEELDDDDLGGVLTSS